VKQGSLPAAWGSKSASSAVATLDTLWKGITPLQMSSPSWWTSGNENLCATLIWSPTMQTLKRMLPADKQIFSFQLYLKRICFIVHFSNHAQKITTCA
jgi:hypothetical protein